MHPLLTGPLTLERVTVPIPDLPLALQGATIVHLSDFHWDDRSLDPALLEAAIAYCHQLQPDLIVLTGDFITRSVRPLYRLLPFLKALPGLCGVYAVLGNHDSSTVCLRLTVLEALESVGIRVLWNEVAFPWGEALSLVGLADLHASDYPPTELLATLPPTRPRLVLAHNPDTAAHLLPWRVDLQLSGHTHGGQLVLPGIGSLPALASSALPLLPRGIQRQIPYFNQKCDRVFQHWEWVSGLQNLGDRYLYVNRGLGTHYPGRLFCPPEITLLSLIQPPSLS